jgi:hypothetical protein
MRTLTLSEVDFVSGGLTTDPKSLWEKFCDLMGSIFGGSSSSGGSSAPAMTLTGAELGQLQRDCRDSGGNFSFEQTSSAAGATLRVVDANGSESYFKVTCTD